MQRLAPAKINLFLHVGERRADGYHDLQSLVVFAKCGDMVEARPAPRTSLALSGPHAAGLSADRSNLVLRAADALRQWAIANGCAPGEVELTLGKNLPVASGIGGGSSDAAATLRLLTQLWALPVTHEELYRIGRSLGADVPVCLRALPTIMSGDGESLAPAPDLPGFALVLANPGVAVATADVFAGLQVRTGAQPLAWPTRFASLRELVVFLDRTLNDLAAPAKRIAPAIMQAESALVQSQDCLLARMSGSGATCFGIYPDIDAARRAASALRTLHAGWWVEAVAPLTA
ncbi:MAG: 4-(cytidine 5'-diphospho)-2-C-methyl-D-erythritol kinase [Alphaproteobacteria bacterium]